jgi:predicted RNA-binding protein with PIN domain
MQGYQTTLLSYTAGRGRMSCSVKGYAPCHNQEEVLAGSSYDSEQDTENPTGSVFCAHGAGFIVPYDQVYQYMHLEGRMQSQGQDRSGYAGAGTGMVQKPEAADSQEPGAYDRGYRESRELEEIFRRTYGGAGQERKGWKRRGGQKSRETRSYNGGGDPKYTQPPRDAREYLLVDGYNIIFGWPSLANLAKTSLSAARETLMDILCDYQGYRKMELILVFDAYKVEGNPGSTAKYHNIHVVYTREAETADQYIEKVTHEIGRRHRVTVATSDGLEQVIILGQGAARMSAQGLYQEIQAAKDQVRQEIDDKKTGRLHNYLQDYLPEEMNEDNDETNHIPGGQ